MLQLAAAVEVRQLTEHAQNMCEGACACSCCGVFTKNWIKTVDRAQSILFTLLVVDYSASMFRGLPVVANALARGRGAVCRAHRFHSSQVTTSTSKVDLFNPTEEHLALRQMLRSFVENEVDPQALEHNRQEKFNVDLFR